MLPAASAGANAQPAIGIGKFHGTIDADDAERLAEGDVDAAGHRDLPAEQPLRRRAVVGQDVADVAGLPAGVADRVAGVAHLELRELLEVGVDRSANRRSSRPRSAGATCRHVSKARRARATAASVSATSASGTVVTISSVAGLTTS